MKLIGLTCALLLAVASARADTVALKGGGKMEDCRVVQRDDKRVVMIYGGGLMTLSTSMVDEVKPEPAVEIEKPGRLADWETVLVKLGAKRWATDLKQIPATVIDVGVLKHVPYRSFRVADDTYEVNVYGDPDFPSGIEIGVVRGHLATSEQKQRCREFLADLLNDVEDRVLIPKIVGDEGAEGRGDLSIEVTPHTGEDSYGGWWVSAYLGDALEKSRATEAELQVITVARETKSKPPARPTPAAEPSVSTPKITWSPSEVRQARQPASTTSSGDRVYVRGYYRKDGTYVQGHSRRRPRK